MTVIKKGNVTALQAEMAFEYVLNHRIGSCPKDMSPKWPGKTLQAKVDWWCWASLEMMREELNQMDQASAKQKLDSETWWAYWDRVWADKILPGETPEQFVKRLKSPSTIGISEAKFQQMRDQADRHKLADEPWWECWERTASVRKLPSETWSQYWVRTIV